jgi:hypothetical protein
MKREIDSCIICKQTNIKIQNNHRGIQDEQLKNEPGIEK